MIEFAEVSKNFGPQDILIDVSFRIHPGEHVGIVGPNGSGKSTLFWMIQGEMSPDRGTITLPKDARLGHLRQQLNAHAVEETLLAYTADAIPRLKTIHDEIEVLETNLAASAAEDRQRKLHRLGELQHDYEHLGGYEMTSRAEAALTGLGFSVPDLAKPFASFSGGWQMRAELARTLIAQPDILLLDEPSNYLDVPAVEWLQRHLREYKGTMLLISHDRYLLQTLTQLTLEVADGEVTRYEGGYAYYTEQREARFAQRVAARKNQDRKRAEIERFVERFRAKNTKASQVQSRLKALDRMETVNVSISTQSQAPIRIPAPPHSGAETARLEGVGTGYEEDQWVFRNVDLSLQRGEKLALVGYNGMGKTTLLRILAGVLEQREGKRSLGHKVVIGYQSQEFAETMPPNQSVYDIARAATPEAQVPRIRSILGSFGFSGEAAGKPCSVLSGGEKIRLAFARIFMNPPNLLILDEPTTHLDLRGRETLEKALREYAGTICLVSHDITFVRNVATSILALTPGGIIRCHGDYDYYVEKYGDAATPDTPRAPGPPKDRKAAKRARAEERQAKSKRKRELEKALSTAEKLIAAREAEREELVGQLSTGGEGTDFAETNRRLKEIEAELHIHTSEWEEAGLALESLDE